MNSTPPNPVPFDQDDIWSLEDSLPLNQVIALARDRATRGDVTAQAFMAIFAQEDERSSYRRQAADGGDVVSMLQLAGQALASGDHAQAFTWFEHAAAQGSLEARVRLGIMIAKGQGTTPDPIAAISHICAAYQAPEQASVELVLDETDFPFDLTDRDVYYRHVIDRIFADYSRQDRQRVYDYLHQCGLQAESDDELAGPAPVMAEAPALEYAPRWLSQFLRGLASQSDSSAYQSRLLSAVLEAVYRLQSQQTDSLELAWFAALQQPETLMARLHAQFPNPPDPLKILYAINPETIKSTTDAVWPTLRHAYHRVQQQQAERAKSSAATAARQAQTGTAPAAVAVAAPSASSPTAMLRTAVVRFAPYQFDVTPVRCGNRACTWTGSIAQSVNQRCPLCKNPQLIRVGGARLLNGSIHASQRDGLLKKHVTALRSVSWFLYATSGGYHVLAAKWGNAAFKLE